MNEEDLSLGARLAMVLLLVAADRGAVWIETFRTRRQLAKLDEDDWRGRKKVSDRFYAYKVIRRVVYVAMAAVLLLM